MSEGELYTTDAAGAIKHKRNYKACIGCRQRRLRCDQGDPDHPDPSQPCKRCKREGRTCVFAETSNEGRKKRRMVESTAEPHPGPSSSSTTSTNNPTITNIGGPSNFNETTPNPILPSGLAYASRTGGPPKAYNNRSPTVTKRSVDLQQDPKIDTDLLASSSLHNPGDALHILAAASTLDSAEGPAMLSPGGLDRWPPIAEDILQPMDALRLLELFRTSFAPLYPLVPKQVFEPNYLPYLLTSESLLLGSMISIAARYISKESHLHIKLHKWIQSELMNIIDGDPTSRHISNVEALLLLSEWPAMTKKGNGQNSSKDKLAVYLATIRQTDALSWTYIGLALRLAQELNLEWKGLSAADADTSKGPLHWKNEREIRTWIYCYNADRQVSVRLGRSAVIQHLSSRWWEKVAGLATREEPSVDWPSGYSFGRHHGLLAALIGTVHERFFTESDITNALLRTGHWEHLLRSMSLEISNFHEQLLPILNNRSAEANLTEMELDYVRLYGNGIALRALQERLYRIQRDQIPGYVGKPLFNMAEGPFIFAANEAAQNILAVVRDKLSPQVLAACPLRTFHRVLFAATFLLKSLAVGVVEHSHDQVLSVIHGAIKALENAPLAEDHVATGVAALLKQMLSLHHSLPIAPPVLDTTTTAPNDVAPSMSIAGGVTVWPPSEQTFEVDRQQDLAFQDLWGGDVLGDTHMFGLFASWIGDGSGTADTV